jgi:Tfp pilus assembly PilM family ATPase
MFRGKRGWIGIEFGAQALKIAQVERAGGNLRIAHSAVLRLAPPETSGNHGGASQFEWSSEDIAAAIALDYGFTGRRAACVLPMECSDLHAFSIPPGTPEERRTMVAGELENVYGPDTAEREFAFWDCQAPTGQSSTLKENVHVLAAPRKLVARVVEQLSKARLDCHVMDGPPFVLARAAAMLSPAGRSRPVGVLDWGYTSSTFAVASDGKPLYTRHLRGCGVGQLVEAIGRDLDLSAEESIELITGYGLPESKFAGPGEEEMDAILAEIAAPVLETVAAEVTKTMSYLQMQFQEIVPEWLCLVGDGAVVKHAAGALSERLGVPVKLWHAADPGSPPSDPPVTREPLLAAPAALSALAWES